MSWRQQNDRLRHLLLQAKRMQFGRKSERLAGGSAATRPGGTGAGDCRRPRPRRRSTIRHCAGPCRQAPRQPRCAAGAPAAYRGDAGARGHGLPVLPGRDDGDRRGHLRAAGRDPRAVSGDRDEAPEAGLPRLRGQRRANAGAGAADRGRHAHRGAGRARAGVALRRSPAAVSPGADHGAAGRGDRAFHAGVLDRAMRRPRSLRWWRG